MKTLLCCSLVLLMAGLTFVPVGLAVDAYARHKCVILDESGKVVKHNSRDVANQDQLDRSIASCDGQGGISFVLFYNGNGGPA